MAVSLLTVWLPSKFKPVKTGTGSLAERGKYNNSSIDGEEGSCVKKMVTCLRIAFPPNADESTEVTVECICTGLPGILPYTFSAKSFSIAGRCCCIHCSAVVMRLPFESFKGSGKM